MTLSEYIDNLQKRYKLGNATEHTFRGDLQQLIESLVPTIHATNEPKRQSCGAPDYILTNQNDIPIGFIEAKDIGDKDLEGNKKTGNKEQFDRYKASLNNIIFTDYLNFYLYREGEFVMKIAIGKLTSKGIEPIQENFSNFQTFIKDFCNYTGQTIENTHKLAQMLANKTRLLAQVIEKSLTSDENNREDSTLKEQFLAFKQVLIHDIIPKDFADVYAQTIGYGMFAARYHDKTLDTFTRQEAAELIPKSNPFLRKLFQYIAGFDLDDRIRWIVDDLVQFFLACNIEEMLKDYDKETHTEDPIIHFYEDFLSEYDPDLRKSRGVWYTPKPVVSFIVKAVDEILKTDFNLPKGIADNSKSRIKVEKQNKETEKEVHTVQILDPATGTGTFLAEIIKYIYEGFRGLEGIWSSYVENHLLPRLNGFELLMASYAMAHLKLDLLLTETNFQPTTQQRFKIYLTNSLEESHPDTHTLFASWLSQEANEANFIKRDAPVMCVIGNPPYSGVSANHGKWIKNLLEQYKYIDNVHFKEKKHWLNDDYVKFIRYGQYFIEKNKGGGILAYINPHGFLDNPTFRGMRWHLLKAFDKIYTINLHGNAKKRETSPDGTLDQNVFDIQQGVSINIFVKTNQKKQDELGKVFYFDLYGKRKKKYDFLLKNRLKSIRFKTLKPEFPNYFFVPKNNAGQKKYQKGFKISELFLSNNVGFVTACDELNISMSEKEHIDKINDLLTLEEHKWRLKYQRPKDAQSWKYSEAKKDAENNKTTPIITVNYRPFDTRYSLYTAKSGGLYARPVFQIMKHFLKGENIGLCLCKQFKTGENYKHVFVTNQIIESSYISNLTSEITSVFPLYLYQDTKQEQQTIEHTKDKIPNFNLTIIKEIEKILTLKFTSEKQKNIDTFAPIDVFDYVYAVLHSPNYREKYKEFLKTDFPFIPFPKNKENFWELVKLGKEMRKIHLLQSSKLQNYITKYSQAGTNIIHKIRYENNKVYINDNQYFENIEEAIWNFSVGSYQPAQKWLKDRKEKTLEFDDILQYQKIIVAISETNKLMKEIDNHIEIEENN